MTLARTILAATCACAALSCAGADEAEVLGPLAAEPSISDGGGNKPSNDGTSPAEGDDKSDDDKEKDKDKDKGRGKDRNKPPRDPEPDCALEKEDNGSEAKANALGDQCMRGVLSGSNDKDFFRLPIARDGHLLIAHSANNGIVQYKVTEQNGAPVTGLNVTFTDRAPDIAVEANKAYFFQLSFPDLSGNGGPRQYEFTVTLH